MSILGIIAMVVILPTLLGGVLVVARLAYLVCIEDM
jgi:hypothetical protein